MEWKKLACAKCGHVQVSKATKPRCAQCRSYKLNVIETMSMEQKDKLPTPKQKPAPAEPAKPKQEPKLKPAQEPKQEDWFF